MSDSHWQTAALLNDRTRAAIRDRRQAGESIADLAKDYGVPEAFVEALCAWQLGADAALVPRLRDLVARWNVNASLACGQATMEPQGSIDWVRLLRECKVYRACADEIEALLAARVREGA